MFVECFYDVVTLPCHRAVLIISIVQFEPPMISEGNAHTTFSSKLFDTRLKEIITKEFYSRRNKFDNVSVL